MRPTRVLALTTTPMRRLLLLCPGVGMAVRKPFTVLSAMYEFLLSAVQG